MSAAAENGRQLTATQAEELLPGIVRGTRSWYWEQTFKWERLSRRVNLWSLIASTFVTVLAAAPVDPHSDTYPWFKWSIVLASAVSTFLAAVLTKLGIARTAQLREQGRNAMEVLVSRAVNRLLADPMTAKARSEYFDKLIEEVGKIEVKYGFWRGGKAGT